ncbi:uncharacterized protein J8A68_000090 [[Candida] subhashii]|uniref:Cytochrome b5 heme-binding domain-containing protein n=1 Tax=[Candida] subhashii TaxID=561895 RepID=A0A8J5QV96_9ASCO|nr:uncharacterized protein J8A68_000090 [[Candida] subhashii]KAG7666369.1 hypothetical protein J8A68_000090 [[Candida] subhashii]
MSSTTDQTEAEIYNSNLDLSTLPHFTHEELRQYNGTTNPKIYVAIRGRVYDVSQNLNSYGPGKAYNRLAGIDGSRLLGMNKLVSDDKEDWYTEDLDDSQNAIIDKWVIFFDKRYHVIGTVG